MCRCRGRGPAAVRGRSGRARSAAALLLGCVALAACGGGADSPVGQAVSAWTATGSLPTPHTGGEAATPLADGRVLLVGGSGDQGEATSAAAIFDPVRGTWAPTGALAAPLVSLTATLLRDGRVLAAGGLDPLKGRATTAAAIFDSTATDPATGRRGAWTPTAAMHAPRSSHTATLLADGRVLVAGGCDTNCGGHLDDSTASAEIFDPSATDPATGRTGRWLPTAAMAHGRTFHTATLLGTGQVLVVGGDGAQGLAAPEIYVPGAARGQGSWRPAGDEVGGVRRLEHTATLLRDGTVLIVGGSIGIHGSELDTAEIYDPGPGAWRLTGPMRRSRAFHTATLLPTGDVLVAGGRDARSETIATAEVYAPASHRWSAEPAMAEPRSGHTATLLDTEPCGASCGRVLLAGGLDCSRSCPKGRVIGQSAVLYTPEPASHGAFGLLTAGSAGPAVRPPRR